MGGNTSSFVADIALCKSEYNFMMGLIKEEKFNLAKTLTLVARGIEYAFQTARILRVGIVHLDGYLKQS